MMRRYRKKPVVIHAVRWTGNPQDVPKGLTNYGYHALGGQLVIPTLEGKMVAKPGDWIIRGVEGKFYPCKPSVFDATYEPAEED